MSATADNEKGEYMKVESEEVPVYEEAPAYQEIADAEAQQQPAQQQKAALRRGQIAGRCAAIAMMMMVGTFVAGGLTGSCGY
ncbi:uncharacterized protein V2V93DRAFT_377366 [Kockiozyma suomiensis]|uniref:uncharacterized protein n=1 Tax=Kockiozyma suomiensis TaxID=1337062 RepID=UPI0033435EFB